MIFGNDEVPMAICSLVIFFSLHWMWYNVHLCFPGCSSKPKGKFEAANGRWNLYLTMDESKGHLGYVSTPFNSNMCDVQLLFLHGLISSAWCVTRVNACDCLRKYGRERPKRRMRMLYSNRICMDMLFWIRSRPSKNHSVWRWNKYEWHSSWADGSQLANRGYWPSTNMACFFQWLLDGPLNWRDLVEQFLNAWSIKSWKTWDTWNALHLHTYQYYHLFALTV